MMVSLLRLSLWADGEVHQSLSASEIVRFNPTACLYRNFRALLARPSSDALFDLIRSRSSI